MKKRHFFTCGIALWAVLAGEAFAQETSAPVPEGEGQSAENVGDIVVTARRREERLQDVPVAITALSGNKLEALSVRNASDIGSTVPGVYSAPGSARGNSAPTFAIRGQVNRDPALTADPSVGIYFAEIPWARPQGSNVAFIDLASVQVLKGPQGTLFGRNSVAGAILITPNEPVDRVEGRVKLAAGNYEYLNIEGMVNVPLGEGVAARFVGNIEKRDGYMKNVSNGQDQNDLNNYSFRGSLKIQSGAFTTNIIGSWYKSDTNGTLNKLIKVSRLASPGLAAALVQTQALGKYESLSSYGPALATPPDGLPRIVTPLQLSKDRVWSVQAKSELDLGEGALGELMLKNIIGYRDTKSLFTQETVSAPVLTANGLGELRAKQFSEELQLQGKASSLNYVVGAFYFKETGHDFNTGFAFTPILNLTRNRIVNKSYSVFGHFDFDFTEAGLSGLSLTGGARYTRDVRFIDYRTSRATTSGLNPALFNCILQPTVPSSPRGSACSLPKRIVFKEPTWDLGLNYKLLPESMIYLSVARGYRTGGFDLTAQTLLATTPYEPEFATTFEIGSKNQFDIGGMQTRLNVAGYYTKYSDIQRALTAVINNNVVNTTVNAARAHIWGAELELDVKPTDNLELNVSYAYIKPKYDDFVVPYVETNPAFVPPGQTSVIYPHDVSDSQFILISRHSLNVGATYTLPVPEDMGRISLNGTYYYRTSFFPLNELNTARCTIAGDPNPAAFFANCLNNGGKLPSYGLLNLRLNWENVLNQGFDLSVFANNVTNKYYYTTALNTLGSVGGSSALAGPPRMVGIEFRMPFGD